MLDNETKDQLILLRAKGWSYERIAKELGISASTAYDVARKLKPEIDKLRAIQLEAIQERVFAAYEEELTWLGEELKRVQAELRGRDYGYMESPQLYWYQSILMNKIEKKRADIKPPPPANDSDGSEPNKTE